MLQAQMQSQQQQCPPTPYAARPTEIYSPQTPSSAAVTPGTTHIYNSHVGGRIPTTPDGTSLTSGVDPHDASKKSRACESCRGLKVKCEIEPSNPEGPCKRCNKANRACVVTKPIRKRQKKTDSRVAELERKIDALTASLQARGGDARLHGTVSPTDQLHRSMNNGASVGGSAGGSAGGMSHGIATINKDWPIMPMTAMPSGYASAVAAPGRPDTGQTGQSTHTTAGLKRKIAETDESGDGHGREATVAPASFQAPPRDNYVDIVDQGVLTMGQADEFFARYVQQMAPHLPGVVFPPGATAAEIRDTKPVLFLAIMAVASSEVATIQRVLTKELMQVIADKVVVVGVKSIELVQSLQVAVIWYWPPERFEELKFYQLVHMGAVMAIDLGLGRKRQNRGGFGKHIPHAWKDYPMPKRVEPDPTTIEARRTWLTCYFLATNTAMALHRPSLLRWTPFTAECVSVLESSPDAAPTDQYLCHLVWTHKLSEEVGIQFSLDDPSATPNIADARTQYALRGFERDLERMTTTISEDMQQPTLRLSFHVLSLYMHELATQTDYGEAVKTDSDDLPDDYLAPEVTLTAAHIGALSECLTAIDGIFDTFLSMQIPSIRCLPVFSFVRVAYAVVVLVKIYFAASSPKSELGKVINKDQMKVEQHIDSLLEKFLATAADDKSRPASKFLVVLVMLRSWFRKQKQNGGPGPSALPSESNAIEAVMSLYPCTDSAASGKKENDSANTHAGYGTTANTPLQLLSEIATNDSTTSQNTNGGSDKTVTNTPKWYNRPATSAASYPLFDAAGTAGLHHLTTNNWPSSNAAFITNDINLSSLGEDFDQAIDMTMAGLADPSLGMGMEHGLGYVMTGPQWLPVASPYQNGHGGYPW